MIDEGTVGGTASRWPAAVWLLRWRGRPVQEAIRHDGHDDVFRGERGKDFGDETAPELACEFGEMGQGQIGAVQAELLVLFRGH